MSFGEFFYSKVEVSVWVVMYALLTLAASILTNTASLALKATQWYARRLQQKRILEAQKVFRGIK